MPWQELVLSAATELDENGMPAYREVIVTVPRQNGKTTLLLVKKVHRAVMWAARVNRPQRLVYTAQTGNDARKKVLEDEVPILMGSAFSAAVESVRKAAGSEGIVFRGGSRLDVLASAESSGHGRTVDEGYVDEAFDDVDDRREQAILPAMSTRRDGQMWVVSTMGTDASLYLNRKIDAGREASLRSDAEIAYFEWSADEHADIDDLATWYSCMPALDITVTERAIRHARETMTEGEFRRAFLNQRTMAEDRVIPTAIWEAVCDPQVQPDGRVVFAIDCNPERSSSSIAVADSEGRVELVDHERGTGWLVTRAHELSRKWSAPVAVDPGGPAGSFIPDLKALGVKVLEVGGGDLTKACGLFYDACADRKIQIRTDSRLDAAVAAAKKRPSGDAWVWTRKSSLTDISPVVAGTVAYWAAQQASGPSTYISLNNLEE
jgi:hypothetical protein